jgi:putative ABC transport system substrate-binding protein
MRRREFLALVGVAAAWPLAARAQQRMPVIGYLGSESSQLFASRLDAFRQGLRETGYEEGRNVMIEYRWAEGHNDRLPQLAADLVRRQVDVIATPGSFVAGLAAKAATTSIPIVFETGADPIAVGLVTSMNRPDGNVTGITSLNAEVEPKRLELLHSLAPAVSTFALLVNPTNPKHAETTAGKLSAAAEAVGVKFHIVKAASEDALEAVFAQIAALGAGGLVVGNDIFFTSHATQMADLTVRHGMPAVQSSPEFARSGGLMSYGGSFTQSHNQAGMYTGRILKGNRPGDLPVQQVTSVELVINMKTAKALSLTVPLDILARADEVIE